MKTRSQVLCVSLLALLVSACASSPMYRAADRDGDTGYSETKLADNRYRVNFTGSAGTASAKTQDAALLRAAELTRQQGYDWFRVTDRKLDRRTERSVADDGGFSQPPEVYRSCGLVSCQTTVVSSPDYAGSDVVSTRSEYTASLEIVLGKYPKPDKAEAYDARELQTNLAKLKQPG